MKSRRFESKFEDVSEAITYLLITVIIPITPIISSIIVGILDWYFLITFIAAAVGLFYDTLRETRNMRKCRQKSRWVIIENAVILLALAVSMVSSAIGLGATAANGEYPINVFAYVSAGSYCVTIVTILVELVRVLILTVRFEKSKKTKGTTSKYMYKIAHAAKDV